MLKRKTSNEYTMAIISNSFAFVRFTSLNVGFFSDFLHSCVRIGIQFHLCLKLTVAYALTCHHRQPSRLPQPMQQPWLSYPSFWVLAPLPSSLLPTQLLLLMPSCLSCPWVRQLAFAATQVPSWFLPHLIRPHRPHHSFYRRQCAEHLPHPSGRSCLPASRDDPSPTCTC